MIQNIKIVFLFFGLIVMGIPVLSQDVPQNIPADDVLKEGQTKFVILRALDKITARATILAVPIKKEMRFGSLAITPQYCRSRPPEEQPETFSFLEIDDVKLDKSRERIFSGWMMASNPALNALEHPVYDIWVISCKIVAADTSKGSE